MRRRSFVAASAASITALPMLARSQGSEPSPGIDLKTKTVTGDIRHFSRYAVAW